MPKYSSSLSRDSDLTGLRVGQWVEIGSWLAVHQDGLKTPQVILIKSTIVNNPQKSHVLIC